MNTSALKFYNDLASSYRLIYQDFDGAVQRQGRVLDKVIRRFHPPGKKLALLDCSCGIGTQAVGLAQYNYEVHATDLSPRAVREARKVAKRFGASISLGVADFRELSRQVKGLFDVVISCDNSLPHLLTDRDLLSGLRNIYSKLKPGGLFLLGVRDYDSLLKTRPDFTPPTVKRDSLGERVYFQVWDWQKGKNIYTVHLFLLRRIGRNWKTQCHTTRYRAMSRKELTALMKKSGFTGIRWLMPKETGFFQPLSVAFRK